MQCGIVRCTRGKTTIHMLWVWVMEPQAVRTTGRRWRNVGSVVMCAMSHVEGGLRVGGDKKFKMQVRVTQGPQHTLGPEICVKRSNVVRVEKPTLNMAPQPQPHHKPQPAGTEQPPVPHTGGKDPVMDIPDTLPGNWYQVLGVRYPGATTVEIKWAYKQLSVKVHPDKSAQHREKAEGLFKQIGKAKDGLLDTEARRRHDADIQRGTRCQQREVRHGNRGAATRGPAL